MPKFQPIMREGLTAGELLEVLDASEHVFVHINNDELPTHYHSVKEFLSRVWFAPIMKMRVERFVPEKGGSALFLRPR